MYKKKFKRHNYYIIFSITFKCILLHANYISKKRIEFYLSLNPLTFVHKTQKLFRNMYLFYLYVCVFVCVRVCLSVYIHTMYMQEPLKARTGIRSPGNGAIDVCEPPYESWGKNLGPLQEQVHLTSEKSLQPHSKYHFIEKSSIDLTISIY